jgi:hypothetical protein
MTSLVSLAPPPRRAWFAWFLPLVFAAGCALGALWPGHRGQLFSVGALPGIWASFLVGEGAEPPSSLLPTLLAGLPILWFLGRLLDRLGADFRIWLALAAIFAAGAGYWLLQGHGDLELAIDHHGSLQAYVVCALQLGAFAASVLTMALSGGRSRR